MFDQWWKWEDCNPPLSTSDTVQALLPPSREYLKPGVVSSPINTIFFPVHTYL